MFESVALQAGIISLEIVEDFRLEDQEPAVDPAFADLGFLGEFRHEVAIKDEAAKARWRTDSGDGGDSAMGTVKLKQLLQVQVTDAISVGEHEGIALKTLLQPSYAPTGVRFLTGISQMNNPIVSQRLVPVDLSRGQVEAQAAAEIRVIDEEALYDIAPISQRDIKFFQAVM